MLGLFCGSDCKTNEEYKKRVKARIIIFIGIVALGVITFFITIIGNRCFNLKISEDMLGIYSGFGFGLVVIGVILLIKNILILKNEEKLRAVRISNTDERNKEISLKASRIALGFMLVSMYLIALIGGIWYPEITKVIFFIICLFLVVYLIAYKVISRKI